jgi:hypothetical protein
VAIEETLAELRLGGSMRWPSSGRRAHVYAAFDQLNGRYREIIAAYPWSLPFDLPFGMPLRDGDVPVPPSQPPSRPAPNAATAGHLIQAPPVIGGEMPRSWTVDFDPDSWLDLGEPGGPGLVG